MSRVLPLEVKPRKVTLYTTPSNTCPFTDWIESLGDGKTEATILTRIGRVRLGNFGDCEPVGQGVSELVIDFGPGYRVYYGQFGFSEVVILNGGDKSSQQSDIRLAYQYWENHKAQLKKAKEDAEKKTKQPKRR